MRCASRPRAYTGTGAQDADDKTRVTPVPITITRATEAAHRHGLDASLANDRTTSPTSTTSFTIPRISFDPWQLFESRQIESSDLLATSWGNSNECVNLPVRRRVAFPLLSISAIERPRR